MHPEVSHHNYHKKFNKQRQQTNQFGNTMFRKVCCMIQDHVMKYYLSCYGKQL